jgi:hypothetical protein
VNVYESYRGGLYVVERPSDRDFIQKRLRELDPRLFVQREIGMDQRPVWTVVVDGNPPIPILEWRDDRGDPIPHLTENIVYRVAAMPREAGQLMQSVLDKNRALRERKQREHRETQQEIFREMIPMMQGRSRILAPRGQKLYQQRNRRRARGEL